MVFEAMMHQVRAAVKGGDGKNEERVEKAKSAAVRPMAFVFGNR